jgi:FkbM family methyltransferase
MPSIANRALSVYRKDGALVLGKKALRRAYIRSYCQAISYLGSYSLTLGTQTVEFSAPTPAMVERNRKRFRSEYDELDSFLQTIQADDVVYDIGANTGLYSLFAAGKCEQGSIVAFDPYPPNVEVLRRNITRNNLHNIEVMELGLSSTVGEVEFSQPSKEDVGYGSSSIKVESGDSTIKIPTTTVDRLVANGVCPPPNVVKIDVEGAEKDVLNGATGLAGKQHSAFIVEMHATPELGMKENADQVLNWCSSVGYQAWYLKEKTALNQAQPIEHRGRCHLLLLPKGTDFPDYLNDIQQNAKIGK